jgi:hypothetical protein
MFKARLLVAVFAVGMSVMVVVSATASAEWMVNKKNFGAGSKMALMTKGINNGWELEFVAIRIVCEIGETIEGVGAEISGTNQGKANSVVFNGCAVTVGSPPCSISSNQIKTVPVLIEV